MVRLTEYGTAYVNWLALFWAQYERAKANVGFWSSSNLIGLGLNLLWNMSTFALQKYLHSWLCRNENYLFTYCYDFHFKKAPITHTKE